MRMNHNNYNDIPHAPLYEALKTYNMKRQASFHVPGHKNGQAYIGAELAYNDFLSAVMGIDTTEITGTDDLHDPKDVILEAQQLAAALFGAEDTFFLIGGSTVGNLALILSVCTGPGDVVLVQRNVHKSVIHGLMLAQANAVFLTPECDYQSGLHTIPSDQTIHRALQRYPEAKALVLTNPNYYGMGRDLTSIASLCHASGIPLLVDEAHGAHFGLHPDLPKSSLEAGADGVVQSTHKMLTAMTMGAMLHVQGELLNRNLVKQRLTMVQSSSPSYPIMASLDLTRSMIQSQGPSFFTQGLACSVQLYAAIHQFRRINVVQLGANGKQTAYNIQDPFKVIVYDKMKEWSGYRLQQLLEELGCVPEMSDHRYVVLALSPATTGQDIDRLISALTMIDQRDVSTWNNYLSIQQPTDINDSISDQVCFSTSILNEREVERIPLEQSIGRISAEMIIPYPPGIPLLYAGEQISEQSIAMMAMGRETGAKFQGVADCSLQTIRVVCESGDQQ